MNRQETLDCLDREGIGYELTEHKAVYNMAELAEVDLPYPHLDAKNLFVRDDKRLNYYLITVRGEKRVNLKDFRRHDTACRVRFYLDQDFLEEPGIIGIHPNDNTATVWLKTRELVELIRRHGTPTEIVPF